MQRWRGHAEQLGEAMREYSDILWTDLDKRMKNGQTNGAWLEKGQMLLSPSAQYSFHTV